MGNYARVDELGFVTPELSLDAAATHCFTRIPSKIDRLFNLLVHLCRESENGSDLE